MLSKSRIVAIIVLGIGIAMVAWALLWPRLIHADARMPLDLQHTTFRLHDPNATIDEEPADFIRQYHVELLPPADADQVTLRVGITDRTQSEDDLEGLISASVWSYTIDRLSGEALTPAIVGEQLASPTVTVDIPGVWFKFPTDAQRTNYQVFDPFTRSAVEAVYQESYEEQGRTIHKYEQTTDTLGRVFSVDAVSGLLVNLEERSEEFSAELSVEDQAKMLAQAVEISDGNVAKALNWVVLAIGALLTLGALITAWRAPTPKR